MNVVIFAGPSLPPSARPVIDGFSWRPPARQGDLYRAALENPSAIGLVDGYFETVPSVWHKEILWALSQGIRVFGSSSVGALRAAELCTFGMHGVGKVFEDIRNGILQDDDEVALLHAPEELDYAPLTEAMVNMRATSAKTVCEGRIDTELARALLGAAKSLFYKERTWEAAGVSLSAIWRFRKSDIEASCQTLCSNFVDQKRVDAVAMLNELVTSLFGSSQRPPVSFSMAQTAAWRIAAARSAE
jgi:hypothetical protein